ncbi:MAG: hypothetical protein HQ522_07275 [Bacteroidetes bacterium]|nr:hypothetical protein [Bacteroidota bacterium]
MNNSNHIIEKVFLEVNTSRLETAHSIKNNISEFLKNELFPRLEVLFNEYDLDKTIVRFDEININLSVEKWKDFEGSKYEITKKIEDKIKLHIQPKLIEQKLELANSEDIQKNSFAKNYQAIFLYFLENGCLPWFGKEEHIYEFIEVESWRKSLANSGFIKKLLELFGRKKNLADRFVNQFSDDITLAFLAKINAKIEDNKEQILNFLGKTNFKIKQLFLKLLFQISISGEINLTKNSLQVFFHKIGQLKITSPKKSEFKNIDGIVKLLPKILTERVLEDSHFFEITSIFKVKNTSENEMISSLLKLEVLSNSENLLEESEVNQNEGEPAFFENERNEIAVQNAGLILLHPFLKHFFVNTGIADKNGTLLKNKLDLAVQSLHFLATGNENVFEGDLVFEKFLCGVPLKRPVPKLSLLTDEIREEAYVLLKEVVKHWTALKNTSPDGLRQMFIQRTGKLIQLENKYKLLVERKTVDILLDKINWNISIVKLPWLEELVIVEW